MDPKDPLKKKSKRGADQDLISALQSVMLVGYRSCVLVVMEVSQADFKLGSLLH